MVAGRIGSDNLQFFQGLTYFSYCHFLLKEKVVFEDSQECISTFLFKNSDLMKIFFYFNLLPHQRSLDFIIGNNF